MKNWDEFGILKNFRYLCKKCNIMGYIYARKNRINGKMYIGQTNNIKQRNRQWKCLKYQYGNDILEEDRQKYGTDAFESKILVECDDSEMNKWEKRFINELGTLYPNGYNKNTGGKNGWHHSYETKKMISESNKESCKNKIDEITERLKHYQFEKGHEPWNKNVKGCFSEETRKKMSKSALNKSPMAEETKRKMSQSRKGIFINNKETSIPVDKINPITNEVVATYPSRNEAARANGVRGTSIGNCCNGGYYSKGKWVNLKTVKGFIYRYHKKEDD